MLCATDRSPRRAAVSPKLCGTMFCPLRYQAAPFSGWFLFAQPPRLHGDPSIRWLTVHPLRAAAQRAEPERRELGVGEQTEGWCNPRPRRRPFSVVEAIHSLQSVTGGRAPHKCGGYRGLRSTRGDLRASSARHRNGRVLCRHGGCRASSSLHESATRHSLPSRSTCCGDADEIERGAAALVGSAEYLSRRVRVEQLVEHDLSRRRGALRTTIRSFAPQRIGMKIV